MMEKHWVEDLFPPFYTYTLDKSATSPEAGKSSPSLETNDEEQFIKRVQEMYDRVRIDLNQIEKERHQKCIQVRSTESKESNFLSQFGQLRKILGLKCEEAHSTFPNKLLVINYMSKVFLVCYILSLLCRLESHCLSIFHKSLKVSLLINLNWAGKHQLLKKTDVSGQLRSLRFYARRQRRQNKRKRDSKLNLAL